MKNILSFLLTCLSLPILQAQNSYDLQFTNPMVDHNTNQWCADIQIRSGNSDSFVIGSHTIFFTYNNASIEKPSFTSENFNNTNQCISGESTYVAPAFYAKDIQGVGNFTTTIDSLEQACLNVSPTWLNFGKVCFDVVDNTQAVNLQFDESETIINYLDATATGNEGDPKDKAEHQQGSLTGLTNLPTALNLQVKAFLSGAYQSGSMQTELRSQELIPLTQPYNQSPWNYNGQESVANIAEMPTNTVDWILIEVRDNATSSANTVLQKAALLLADGSIVDANNPTVNSLDVSSLTANTDYYIVIKHRNHLPVMSALPINLSSSSLTTYDFSSGIDKAWKDGNLPNEPMKVQSGKSLLWAGNANSNQNVSYSGGSNDRTAVLVALGFDKSAVTQGYNAKDVNMDGDIKYSGGSNDRTTILVQLGFDKSKVITAHLP